MIPRERDGERRRAVHQLRADVDSSRREGAVGRAGRGYAVQLQGDEVALVHDVGVQRIDVVADSLFDHFLFRLLLGVPVLFGLLFRFLFNGLLGGLLFGLLDRLLNGFLGGFLDRLLDGLLSGLLDRLLDGFLDGLLSGLLDGFLDGLLNRLLDGLLDRLFRRLLDRLLDGQRVIDALVRKCGSGHQGQAQDDSHNQRKDSHLLHFHVCFSFTFPDGFKEILWNILYSEGGPESRRNW